MRGISEYPKIAYTNTVYVHVTQDVVPFCATAPLHRLPSTIVAVRGKCILVEPRKNLDMFHLLVSGKVPSWQEYEKLYVQTSISDALMPAQLIRYCKNLGTSTDFFIIRYPTPQQVLQMCPLVTEVYSQKFYFTEGDTYEFQGINAPHIIVTDLNGKLRYVPLLLHSTDIPTDATASSASEPIQTQLSLLSMHEVDLTKQNPLHQIDMLESIVRDVIRFNSDSELLKSVVKFSSLLHDHKIKKYPIDWVPQFNAIQSDSLLYFTAANILRIMLDMKHISITAHPNTGEVPKFLDIPDEHLDNVEWRTSVLCSWYPGKYQYSRTSAHATIIKGLSLLPFHSNKNKMQSLNELRSIINLLQQKDTVDDVDRAWLFEAVVDLARITKQNKSEDIIDNFKVFGYKVEGGFDRTSQYLTVLHIYTTILSRCEFVYNLDVITQSYLLFFSNNYRAQAQFGQFMTRHKLVNALSEYMMTFVTYQTSTAEKMVEGKLQKRSGVKRGRVSFIQGVEKEEEIYEWVV